MNAQEAMNRIRLERLRRRLSSGDISPEQLQRLLSRAIEREMARGDRAMDTRFISACEDLLWQLNAPATQHIQSNQRAARYRLFERLRQGPAPRPLWLRLRPVALALSLTLALGGGLWLASQRPTREQKHSSLHGEATLQPGQEPDKQGIGETPLPLYSPSPSPTPSPTPNPTPEPTAAPAPTPEATLTPEPSPSPAPATQAPPAREKYRSLQQLREEASDRWQASYSVQGKEIRVDVPIIIPEGDELAALRLNWLDARALVFGDDSSIQRAMTAAYPEGLSMSDGFMGMIAFSRSDGERNYFYGPGKGGYSSVIAYPDAEPAQSDYPKDAPFKLLLSLLNKLQLPTEDIVVDAQAGTSGFFYARQLKRGEQMPEIPFAGLDQDKPVPGFEQGYYRLMAVQRLRGLKLFPFEYIAPPSQGPHSLESFISLQALSDQVFDLQLRMVKESGVREEKLPLMNMAAVIKSAEALIEQGMLRRVDSLELGYMLYYAEHLGGVSEQKITDGLLALPVWRLRGIMVGDPGQPTSQSMLDEAQEYPGNRHGGWGLELRFNAQTGEYINPTPMQPSLSNPAILTWEQMEQGEGDIELF